MINMKIYVESIRLEAKNDPGLYELSVKVEGQPDRVTALLRHRQVIDLLRQISRAFRDDG